MSFLGEKRGSFYNRMCFCLDVPTARCHVRTLLRLCAVEVDDATSLKREIQNLEIKNKVSDERVPWVNWFKFSSVASFPFFLTPPSPMAQEMILELRRNEDMLTIQYQVTWRRPCVCACVMVGLDVEDRPGKLGV